MSNNTTDALGTIKSKLDAKSSELENRYLLGPLDTPRTSSEILEHYVWALACVVGRPLKQTGYWGEAYPEYKQVGGEAGPFLWTEVRLEVGESRSDISAITFREGSSGGEVIYDGGSLYAGSVTPREVADILYERVHEIVEAFEQTGD